MFKKILCLILASASVISSSPISPVERPTAPNQLQKFLIMTTGIQQDEWTLGAATKTYMPQFMLYALKKNKPGTANFMPLLEYTTLAGQRFLDNKDLKKSCFKGAQDWFFSPRITVPREWSYGSALRAILSFCKHAYNAYETSDVIEQYKLGCKRIEMDHDIIEGMLPPDDSYIQLNNPWNNSFKALWAIKRLVSPNIVNKILKDGGFDYKLANEKREITAIMLFVIAGYVYTRAYGKTFIPKATLEMLAPELQERCEDLLWQQKNSVDVEYTIDILKAIFQGQGSKL